MGGKGTTGNYSMYVNPFMVVNSMKFTKHFYIEGQRIVSKLGDMGENQDLLNPKDTARAGNNGNHPVDWDNKQEHLKDILIANFEELGLTGAVFTAGKSGKIPYGQIKKYFRNNDGIITGGNDTITGGTTHGNRPENLRFYYHPDHLGSSSYITDVSGEVYQHMEYFPFGETFIEERTDGEYTTYLYNGKEFDEEIGLYYYGARYYDPKTSVWQSVDPLTEKYPSLSPYAYCADNPIKFVDIDGRWFDDKNNSKAQRIERKLINKQFRLANKAKKMAKRGKDVGDIEARQTELDKSLNDISDMRNDKNTEYRYASAESKSNPAGEGNPNADGMGTNVVTMYVGKKMGSKLHEGRHGGDIARGTLNTRTYGVQDEISAYRAQYSWSGKFEYIPYTDFSIQANLMKLTGGTQNFKVTLTNINKITPGLINNLVDKPGLMQVKIYPPQGISINQWNNN